MLIFFSLILTVLSSEIFRITPKNFDKVTTDTDILIRFCPMYEPICRSTQSSFEGLTDTFEEYEDIAFGEFDCSKHADWCEEHKLTKDFPVYIAYTTNKHKIQQYPFEHNINTLSKFIETVFEIKRTVYTHLLTPETFKKNVIENHDTQGLVMFYTRTCKFSRDNAEYLETIAKFYGNEKDLIIGRIDCDIYPEICKEQEIDLSYQYHLYGFHMKSPHQVYPPENIPEFVEFMNRQFNKDRDSKGFRPSTFGTWHEFDDLARGYLHADNKKERQNECLKYFIGLAYVDVMKKIDELGTDDWIEVDIHNLEVQLENSHQMNPKDIDEICRKINVMRQFL